MVIVIKQIENKNKTTIITNPLVYFKLGSLPLSTVPASSCWLSVCLFSQLCPIGNSD